MEETRQNHLLFSRERSLWTTASLNLYYREELYFALDKKSCAAKHRDDYPILLTHKSAGCSRARSILFLFFFFLLAPAVHVFFFFFSFLLTLCHSA